MKSVGLFEARTKLTEICEDVARTGEGVTITRRGRALVRILPAEDRSESIFERWQAYRAAHPDETVDEGNDFQPHRSRERSSFRLTR